MSDARFWPPVGAEASKELIERFYAAFGRCDGAAMTACYAPGAHFRDPAFGDLEGNEVGAMWRMLTGRATDLKIELKARAQARGQLDEFIAAEKDKGPA